jgi:hypothetical protein
MPVPCRLTRQTAGSCVRVSTSGSSEAEVIVVDEPFDASTLQGAVARIIQLTALDQVFRVYASFEEAGV